MQQKASGLAKLWSEPPAVRSLPSLVVLLTIVFTSWAGIAVAQETEPTPELTEELTAEVDPAVVEQLQEGSQVYSQTCSSCHQPGGTGLIGQFPPLIDNPRMDDAAYVEDVINNGKQGELVVAGETYDSVMPSFGTLSDEETEAVIAYIQNDFQVPSDGAQAAGPTVPVAGTGLPMGVIIAFSLALAVAGLVLSPRLLSTNDRLNVPWLDVGVKTAVITIAFIVFTVVVPDWAIKSSAVSKLDRPFQDAIGVTLWGAGFVAVLWGLWYAHRQSRI